MKINGCIKLIKTIDLGLQKSTRKSKFKPNLTRKTTAVEIVEEQTILTSNLTPRRKYLEKNIEKKRKELNEQEILNDFRKNLKKVTNPPKIVPDSDIEKMKSSHMEIRKIRKQEDQEDKEGRKKSITPRSDSEEGAGGKRASDNRKWPKSTKNLVNYFKKLENSVQSGGNI